MGFSESALDAPRHRNFFKDVTERQREVLAELKRGKTEKEVASRLSISVHTVHVHVKAIYKRFGVNSRSELLSLWIVEDDV